MRVLRRHGIFNIEDRVTLVGEKVKIPPIEFLLASDPTAAMDVHDRVTFGAARFARGEFERFFRVAPVLVMGDRAGRRRFRP